MKIHKNKLVLISMLVFLIIIGFAIVLKTAVSFSISEKHLKKSVAQFFKDNFDKAVEFEDIRLTIFGNIVITNLNISTSSDFNDNISLIKSRNTNINLDVLSLLRNRLLVQEIIFNDTEITLAKMYGESYDHLIKTKFMSGKALHEIEYIDFNDFSLEFNDGKLIYMEGFRDTKTAIECRDLQTRIKFRNGNLIYDAKGTLIPDADSGTGRGSFSFSGSIIFEKLKQAVLSRNMIHVDNFDISYLNTFLKEHMERPLTVNGGVSVSMEVNTYHDNFSVTGTVNLDDFSLESQDNNASYTMVSNESLGVNIIADILDHRRKIVFKRFELDDGTVHLLAGGTFIGNNEENSIDAAFEAENIDLSSVSGYITPWKDTVYEGIAGVSGRYRYSFNRQTAGNIALNLGLSDFAMTRKSRGEKKHIVEDLDLAINIRDNSLDLKFSVLNEAGDLALRCRSIIRQWSPFKSQSAIDIRSRRLSVEVIGSAAIRGIKMLLDSAYEDSSRGYEASFVNQKPAGMFAESNNIDLRMQVDRIKLNGGDGFRDLVMNISLNDGYLKLQNFNLSGYDGNYTLDVTGYFNSESPGVNAKGKFENINMEKLAHDMKCSGVVRGNLSIDMDYQVNGYRTSHFLENAKANMSINMDSGYLNGNKIQDSIRKLIADRGFGKTSINELTINRAAVNLHQQGENFFVDGITVQSDKLNLNAYGSYSYAEGLKVPLNAILSLEQEGDQVVRTINVPGLIRGHLLKPFLQITSGKETAELPLFNLN